MISTLVINVTRLRDTRRVGEILGLGMEYFLEENQQTKEDLFSPNLGGQYRHPLRTQKEQKDKAEKLLTFCLSSPFLPHPIHSQPEKSFFSCPLTSESQSLAPGPQDLVQWPQYTSDTIASQSSGFQHWTELHHQLSSFSSFQTPSYGLYQDP